MAYKKTSAESLFSRELTDKPSSNPQPESVDKPEALPEEQEPSNALEEASSREELRKDTPKEQIESPVEHTGPGRYSFIREPLHNSTVKISGVNADFVKKYAHICRITQTELVYNFVNEDYQKNADKADIRKLSFEARETTITKPKERGRMVPLRLTEKLRDFVDDYILVLGISKSTYIDDLVEKHRLAFLAEREKESE